MASAITPTPILLGKYKTISGLKATALAKIDNYVVGVVAEVFDGFEFYNPIMWVDNNIGGVAESITPHCESMNILVETFEGR